MTTTYAKGGNFVVEIEAGVAQCRVWKRPDVSREEGARFATEKVTALVTLAEGSRTIARGLILDLRDAPPVWGPITQNALERIVTAWGRAHRPVVAIVADEAIQALQMRRIMRERAGPYGKVVTEMVDALGFVDDLPGQRQ